MKLLTDRTWYKNIMAILAILGGIASIIYGIIQITESSLFKPGVATFNYEIVVDSSLRMTDAFGESTKWEAAKTAVKKALDGMDEDDNIAFRKFGGHCAGENTELLVGFDTNNKKAVEESIKRIEVGGETTLVSGILAATADFNDKDRFSGGGVIKSIIVISGGGDLCHHDAVNIIRDRLQKLQKLDHPLNVKIQLLGMSPASDQKKVMAKIADVAGGQARFAETLEELENVAVEIIKETKGRIFAYINLVKNPGAEDGLNHWETPPGYSRRQSNPPPRTGKYYFFAGANKSIVEAKQIIDLSHMGSLIDANLIECEIRGFMRNYEGYDLSELEVKFILGNGEMGAPIIASTPINSRSEWSEFHTNVDLPAKVRTAQVLLRSIYQAGASNNDGYFDDIYLGCGERPKTAGID